MSEVFFSVLGIPEPAVNLGVGSGSPISQLSRIMQGLEQEFLACPPDVVVVVGDVNSTLAAALTAQKMNIPVAHVEAGLRSFDNDMPEEVNRRLVDSLSNWLFASEPAAVENLLKEGIPPEPIHLVGNVMIDTLRRHLAAARSRQTYQRWALDPDAFVLLTLHRPSNVDDPERLSSILRAVHTISQHLPVVFPIHPRTQKRLDEFGFAESGLCGYLAVEPLDYHDMLCLMDAARLVLTDSGGIQEETTALRVPCLTLRENTERPITVERGGNRLVGWRTDAILDGFQTANALSKPVGETPPNWDGRASQRIADILAGEIVPADTSKSCYPNSWAVLQNSD